MILAETSHFSIALNPPLTVRLLQLLYRHFYENQLLLMDKYKSSFFIASENGGIR